MSETFLKTGLFRAFAFPRLPRSGDSLTSLGMTSSVMSSLSRHLLCASVSPREIFFILHPSSLILLVLLIPLAASANVATHHLINSFGGVLEGTSHRSYTAGAQGHPVGLIADSEGIWTKTVFNFTGFIQPGDAELLVDTDDDGIADAVDPDSDSDGFADIEEILGTWFGGVPTDPLGADSDGDGDSDYEEWQTGTNPTDPDSQFKITDIVYNSATDVRIQFRSVGGRQYELFRADTVKELSGAVSIDGIEGAPGSGPFNESTTEFIDVPFSEDYFYGVRLVP